MQEFFFLVPTRNVGTRSQGGVVKEVGVPSFTAPSSGAGCQCAESTAVCGPTGTGRQWLAGVGSLGAGPGRTAGGGPSSVGGWIAAGGGGRKGGPTSSGRGQSGSGSDFPGTRRILMSLSASKTRSSTRIKRAMTRRFSVRGKTFQGRVN